MSELKQSAEFKALEEHFNEIKNTHMNELFSKNPNRGREYFLQVGGLRLDYSKNRISDKTLELLRNLADKRGLKEQIKAMFNAGKINTTEDRAVLHTALRNLSKKPIFFENKNIMEDVRKSIEKMQKFADLIRSGSWLGYSNQVITDVVNIGIGGSDLGALMMCKALKKYGHPRLNMFFVSNVDGTQIKSVLNQIHPETTLFIIASKTFSTQETLTNALSAREWFLKHAGNEAHIAKHFVAVSTNKEGVQSFGIDVENMFEFWDWVGGRYSLWSAIGLSIMIYLGKENFTEILQGAFEMDEHFLYSPFENNMPVILALIGVWYINFFGAGSQIIAPYDNHLRYFPKFIQQLDMESNGKSVDKNGERVDYETGPIIWGEMGINAQHAFFQLLHQGTHINPIDLIASLSKKGNIPGHHEILLSNVFAQAQAFMRGKSIAEVSEEMRKAGVSEERIKALAPHREFLGNRPSNIILLDEINPRNLGALVALYEHKIFVQGVIWGINSFDQWGVELGKALSKTILAELKNECEPQIHDSSTTHLIELYKDFNHSVNP